MELPVAPQSYRPSTDTLIRAIHRADLMLVGMAAKRTELDGAVAFTNPARPHARMCNLAAELHVPQGTTAEAVLTGVLDHYRACGLTCYSLRSGAPIWT